LAEAVVEAVTAAAGAVGGGGGGSGGGGVPTDASVVVSADTSVAAAGEGKVSVGAAGAATTSAGAQAPAPAPAPTAAPAPMMDVEPSGGAVVAAPKAPTVAAAAASVAAPSAAAVGGVHPAVAAAGGGSMHPTPPRTTDNTPDGSPHNGHASPKHVGGQVPGSVTNTAANVDAVTHTACTVAIAGGAFLPSTTHDDAHAAREIVSRVVTVAVEKRRIEEVAPGGGDGSMGAPGGGDGSMGADDVAWSRSPKRLRED
jgi:hypothetical protein